MLYTRYVTEEPDLGSISRFMLPYVCLIYCFNTALLLLICHNILVLLLPSHLLLLLQCVYTTRNCLFMCYHYLLQLHGKVSSCLSKCVIKNSNLSHELFLQANINSMVVERTDIQASLELEKKSTALIFITLILEKLSSAVITIPCLSLMRGDSNIS